MRKYRITEVFRGWAWIHRVDLRPDHGTNVSADASVPSNLEYQGLLKVTEMREDRSTL
ncbi:hypothetical protein PILCRDRAFT_3880 [Piloderma croceum F 1598]|uniref:Uncharacterized protein n=1 Tax=Piloderma croceum (strain F 1598) TaxID=765440 RepID=A0A0C3CCJ4_PILCF|nr:hypothetical protein PILCRDRAFT_3880 [Piloderma croceum F 1598]